VFVFCYMALEPMLRGKDMAGDPKVAMSGNGVACLYVSSIGDS